MIRPRDLPDSIVAQLVPVSAFLHSLDPKRKLMTLRPRVGDHRCHASPPLEGDDAVVPAMQHKRRHRDSGAQIADIDVSGTFENSGRVLGRGRHLLKLVEPLQADRDAGIYLCSAGIVIHLANEKGRNR